MKNKGRFTLFSLIILTVLLLLVLCERTYFLTKDNVEKNQTYLSMLATGIEFIGTMILGIVAFWQTKESNIISKLLIEKETEININWLSPAILEIKQLYLANMLEFSEQSPMEGVICVENEKNIKDKDVFLEIKLPFELKNGSIESLDIKNIGFNHTLQDCSKFRLDLKVLNPSPIIVSFNPDEQKYFLTFSINCSFEKLNLINCEEMFVIDFTMIVTSKLGNTTVYTIQVNFGQINGLENFLQEIGSTNEIKLKNIIVTKEKNYGNSKSTKANRKKG